jgi:hypothetical protein
MISVEAFVKYRTSVLLVHKVEELKMHLDPVTIAPVSNAGFSSHFMGKRY